MSLRRVVTSFKVGFGVLVTLFVCATTGISTSYADTPSITDFGQPAEVYAVANPSARCAAFVTLYPDGRTAVQIHEVKDDTLNTFAMGSSLWRLDHGLMWFIQMPVYVREIEPPIHVYGQTSV